MGIIEKEEGLPVYNILNTFFFFFLASLTTEITAWSPGKISAHGHTPAAERPRVM